MGATRSDVGPLAPDLEDPSGSTEAVRSSDGVAVDSLADSTGVLATDSLSDSAAAGVRAGADLGLDLADGRAMVGRRSLSQN